MPTYDYICTSCGKSWELEQRIVEDPVRKCPKCGKNTAKRQISSGAGFILKGGGWYADGYGSKKSSGGDSKAEDKSSSVESKSEKKTDSASTGDTKKSEPQTGGSKDTKGETKPAPKSEKKASSG